MSNEAVRYLGQLKHLERQIRRHEERLDELRNACCGVRAVTYDGDPVQTSPSDTTTELIVQAVELEKEIEIEKLDLSDLRMVICFQISALVDKRYRTILHERYVMDRSMAAIAKKLDVSERWNRRLHNEALDAFEREWLK